MAINLNWIKCDGEKWCDFLKLNLSSSHFDNLNGVYIIWYNGNPGKVVRLGQGVIKDRLTQHRADSEILAYQKYGLFVTWAQVLANQMDGVEAHLANILNPLVGERFPNVNPIVVNAPW